MMCEFDTELNGTEQTRAYTLIFEHIPRLKLSHFKYYFQAILPQLDKHSIESEKKM